MTIEPVRGARVNGVDDKFNCKSPSCPHFDFSKCPPETLLLDALGKPIACMSISTALENSTHRKLHPYLEKLWNGHSPSNSSLQYRRGAQTHPTKFLVGCACGEPSSSCPPPCDCSSDSSYYCCSPYNLPSPTEIGGKCYVENWPKPSTGGSWPDRYDKVFKNQCPDAYSWQFDDAQSTYQCSHADYHVVFCGGVGDSAPDVSS